MQFLTLTLLMRMKCMSSWDIQKVIIQELMVKSTIVSALKLKKRVIVVPRLGQYKEQNNDHQVQIMERFDKQGYIIPCTDLSKLDETVNNAYNFEPKEYVADKQGIIDEITDFINTL